MTRTQVVTQGDLEALNAALEAIALHEAEQIIEHAFR
jgi:hypothetical protein